MKTLLFSIGQVPGITFWNRHRHLGDELTRTITGKRGADQWHQWQGPKMFAVVDCDRDFYGEFVDVFIFRYIGINHPNRLLLSDGLKTPTRICMVFFYMCVIITTGFHREDMWIYGALFFAGTFRIVIRLQWEKHLTSPWNCVNWIELACKLYWIWEDIGNSKEKNGAPTNHFNTSS